MDGPRGTEGEEPLGAVVEDGGVRFSVFSSAASALWVCLFDDLGRETIRQELTKGHDAIWHGFISGLKQGQRYGLRADGPYDPDRGLWFDPGKLLVDPYAAALDRPFRWDPALAAPRSDGIDTADLVPKALVQAPPAHVRRPALWRDGGTVYELSVRSFTRRNPDIAPELRGTIRALAEPAIIDHLRRLRVTAVELMPVTAWINERHLAALGLANAWGYNPVSFMALDPRLAPGGLADLRDTVAALHDAGIGVFLDVVFNHTGESERHGATLSLRGLDAHAYFRHGADGALVNDTGTGNTLDADSPVVQRLVLDTLRHFVRHAGIDGFRFDLATIMGRRAEGFDPAHPLLAAMESDPVLGDRVLIAEPWDIGPGGYQLGRFSACWLEWNDRYRDDVRRFWRGDGHMLGALATRLAGSSDLFSETRRSRSVNFVAAHDGMALADIVAYAHKHNEANGEDNRDGHDDNLSWNCGVEGPTDDEAIVAGRRRDLRALLATLFASRGTLMLTAGDEFGRTQRGNNNAYCQDNEVTWLDWAGRDRELEAFTAQLAELRAEHPSLTETGWLENDAVSWLMPDGRAMSNADWANARGMTMLHAARSGAPALAVLVNGDARDCTFVLPEGAGWALRLASADARDLGDGRFEMTGRSVAFIVARP